MRTILVLCAFMASACAAAADAGRPRLTSSEAPGDANEAVRVEVSGAYGASKNDIQRIATRAGGPLRHCLPNGGGAIQVDVRRDARGIDVTLASGSSLDPEARACAMAALRETFQEDTASSIGGPAVPASGFSSLLTISW